MFEAIAEWFRAAAARVLKVVPARVLVGTVAGVVLLIVVFGWMLHTSPADLLAAESLSPSQIRVVATDLLLNEDTRIREQASRKLTSIGKPAVPVLAEVARSHSDPRVRTAVLDVLGVIDQEAAIAAIEQTMQSPEVATRRAAVQAAANLDHPRTTALLVKALTDSDSGIRTTAANTLGVKKAREGVPALEGALNDPNLRVRRHAARALQTVTGKEYHYRTDGK